MRAAFRRGVRSTIRWLATQAAVAEEAPWSSGGAASNPQLGAAPRARNNRFDDRETLRLYHKLREDGLTPGISGSLAALKACIGLKDIQTGRQIHLQLTASKQDSDIRIANTLVDLYAKCGSMIEAQAVFDRIEQRSIVSWNTIIMGYASNGEGEMALRLFSQMQGQGFTPDSRIFIAALKACASMTIREECSPIGDNIFAKAACLERARSLHADLASRGFESDIFVASTLVDLYAKCGSMIDASRVFDRMPQHDIISWTAIILGHAESGQGELGLKLFDRMQQDEGFIPDARIFVAALKACSSAAIASDDPAWRAGFLKRGGSIHAQIAKQGCESNPFVAGSLVEMYAKCGSIAEARSLFDRLPQRTAAVWNAMIMAYAQAGEERIAVELFERMKMEGAKPDNRTLVIALNACTSLAAKEEGTQINGKVAKVFCLEQGAALHREAIRGKIDRDSFVATSLIDMYAKCGRMDEARRVFEAMDHHTLASWHSIIMGYAQNGQEGRVALDLFKRMRKEGVVPAARHFIAVLKACGNMAMLEEGRKLHDEIRRAGFGEEIMVTNTLINFYGRCGNMEEAQQVFNRAARKDSVTWNALIAGYTHQGDTKNAFHVFERLQEEQGNQVAATNGITFLLLLNACNHAGLVDRGKEIFRLMSKSRVEPGLEHYTCMVDLLGRANKLDDALEMVKSMPHKPDPTLWRAVLGSCHKWNNIKVGRIAFDALLELDAGDATAYVLMANVYTGAGMLEESQKLRAMKPVVLV